MVEWLAGNRIIGTTAERPSASLQSPSVGGWKELNRVTLGSSDTTISVGSLPDKRYYMFLQDLDPSSTAQNLDIKLNGSSSGYTWSRQSQGGSDTPLTGQSYFMRLDSGVNTDHFVVGYIASKSGKNKLGLIRSVGQNGTGASTLTGRRASASKWTNTSDAINAISAHASNNFQSGSEVVVLGWDSADTHTDNFWEELSDVTLGADGDILSSGDFTAKKYLHVQVFIKNSGATARFNTQMTFNGDTTAKYVMRRSMDGANDVSGTQASSIFSSGVTGSSSGQYCLNLFIVNNKTREKLMIGQGFDTYVGSGAGQAPSQRFEASAKWANTTEQITNITVTNSDTSNYDAVSFIKVWGHD